jgi:hypothetical protein
MWSYRILIILMSDKIIYILKKILEKTLIYQKYIIKNIV